MSLELVQIDLRNLEDRERHTLRGVLLPQNLDLDPAEAEQFSAIEYKLEVQLLNESLLVRATISGQKNSPCRVCNKGLSAPIFVDRVDEVLELDEIHGYKVDLTPVIRNLFLLEEPGVVECNNGSCIDRKELEIYLKRKRLPTSPFDSL